MSSIRLALSQFRPDKGEYARNVERIGAVIAQAAQLDPKPDLVAFPETATSGYFVEGGVKEVAVTAGTLARDLHALYHGGGAPDRRRRRVLRALPGPHPQLLPLRHARQEARGASRPSQGFSPHLWGLR